MPRRDDFNPRSPCGERPGSNDAPYGDNQFQSTLPVWGATSQYLARESISFYFNPRSPCGERHLGGNRVPVNISISIHAPRVGSDIIMDAVNTFDNDFNPRSPCGERPKSY